MKTLTYEFNHNLAMSDSGTMNIPNAKKLHKYFNFIINDIDYGETEEGEQTIVRDLTGMTYNEQWSSGPVDMFEPFHANLFYTNDDGITTPMFQHALFQDVFEFIDVYNELAAARGIDAVTFSIDPNS